MLECPVYRPLIQNLERQVRIACQSEVNVLITGATGTGKSSLARRIHQESPRAAKPFVHLNLASVHEGTLESELFGHERGAFTGAESRRTGRLEAAHRGTLFLDEIGEMPLRLQARLLEFLQSRVIVPVGSNREVLLDVRVIAATHRDLEQGVRRGDFREDLFHRLRVLGIALPSLFDRASDLDSSVHQVLESLCKKHGRRILALSEEVALRIESHDWPGNYRELLNVMEYAVIACEGARIELSDLPEWFSRPRRVSEVGVTSSEFALGVAEVALSLDFADTQARFEREYLQRALYRFRGRLNRTARGIGMSKATLIRRIRAYGLQSSTSVELTNLEPANAR